MLPSAENYSSWSNHISNESLTGFWTPKAIWIYFVSSIWAKVTNIFWSSNMHADSRATVVAPLPSNGRDAQRLAVTHEFPCLAYILQNIPSISGRPQKECSIHSNSSGTGQPSLPVPLATCKGKRHIRAATTPSGGCSSYQGCTRGW